MDIRVKATRDFPLGRKTIEKGDVLELEDHVARSLISGQLVVRTTDELNCAGFYNRRDMRATNATAPETTRIMDATISNRQHQGSSSTRRVKPQ